MPRAFLCHAGQNEHFALGLAAYLKQYCDDVFCFEERQRADQSFLATINEAIASCSVFVTLVGEKMTEWQIREALWAFTLEGRSFFTVTLADPASAAERIPSKLHHLNQYPILHEQGINQAAIRSTAIRIVVEGLRLPWRSDGLPLDPHLFSYEKDIIAFFVKSRLHRLAPDSVSPEDKEKLRTKILHGCPQEWPQVVRLKDNLIQSPFKDLEEVGIFRNENAKVLTTALVTEETLSIVADSEQGLPALQQLSFPEAGPRSSLYLPKKNRSLGAAILVSGGIAPGINAVIDGIVQRHWLYAERQGYREDLRIKGLRNGFRAFENLGESHYLLAAKDQHYPGHRRRLDTSHHVNEGGSILGTSRVNELIDLDRREETLLDIVSSLKNDHVDILYVIGGDGSMKAAHAIWNVAQAKGTGLSVVAIPKTMDNDILWVWQSFGFLSAVEKAREVIEQLHTEVESNPRLCIAQLFGSDSGFVVSHGVLASGTGHCDLALIPEVRFNLEKTAHYLAGKMSARKPIPHALVVLAETAIPEDAMRYVGPEGGSPEIEIHLSDDEKNAIREFTELRQQERRIQGQTNDHLRTAGLKIVKRGLEGLLDPKIPGNVVNHHPGTTDWSKLRVFTNEPRHLLRAIPPSCTDIIIGHRLGTLAVDNALAGYTDFMISQWLTEYVLVPLDLVVLGRKRIPEKGIFWKSVLAKTGQANLT